MFTDSHCHINSEDFAADREEVVVRAREMKVEYLLDVSDDVEKTPEIIDFCRHHEKIYTTSGLHPELADKYAEFKAEMILEHIKSPYVVGIGECGLDYYYNADIKAAQLKVFQAHIEAAQESGLPLIVHSRDADEDMMRLLTKNYKIKPFRGELHCFSSGEKLCRAALDIGFYISASGIITFKKSEELRQIFAKVPNERLLIETDAPFLAPTPHRGKRNEPAYVVNTAQVLAEVKGIDIEQLAEITTENFFRLFNKVRRDE
ncbi:MAG: TatD family hydrolase [Alphaproteobacteria bacterium]|nr:TatD family hydrolase [Alphaproteobacteria bacterium]